MKSNDRGQTISRRVALGGLVAGPSVAAVGGARAADTATPGPGVCVLSPEAVEGPFYYDPALVRSDITEGKTGVPLELQLTLIEAAGCAPVAAARVDIWHCDAAGLYSGFDQTQAADVAAGKRAAFLRGTQMVGADGSVTFRTIYPGWYPGRTPHIHLKAFLDNRNVLTTQLYFPDALSEYIFANVKAYAHRDSRDTSNVTDGVLGHTENPRATFLNIREEADRYVATLRIAVDRSAESSARGPGRMGPPPGGPPPGGRPPAGAPPRGPEGGPPRSRPSGPLVPSAKS